ncbi:MAG TPA: MFS transporter [Caldilineaceae bacterium]|nr:MFS transporter [Caldilineaceae bacterium]
MSLSFRSAGLRLEKLMTGALPADVRRNMHTEVLVALAYGAFYACTIPFIPVVLRRLGATTDMLALYAALQFLGSVTSSLSIIVMRRRRTMNVILACWFTARALFVLVAFFQGAVALIALGAIFWLLEGFVIPGYTRILQKIYPDNVRGKVMSTVRMGQVTAILLVTPLAGWALDHIGYPVLFPLACILGLGSVLLFMRLRVDEGPLPPRQTKTFAELGEIVRGDPRFRLYLFAFALFGLGTMLAWPVYPLVQVDRLQLSYSTIGLLGLVESIMWLLSYLIWGRFLDRRGGLAVMRATCAVSMLQPFFYIWAGSAWLLVPAFVARGIASGGFELGRINAGIQLADPERITEYAVIQSTTIGMRGIIAPLISALLLRFGLPPTGIFVLSVCCMVAAWVIFGFVKAPAPLPHLEVSQARWPFRMRMPRV